jgi:hypothetical protein
MDMLWVKHARSCLRLGQHDAHAVAGLGELWVNRFVLATGQPLPVYPDERTSSDRPGCSGSCHFLTHAPQQEKLFDNLVCLREQRGWHGKPEKPTLIVRAHPTAPRLRQNNPPGKISLNLSGKSTLPARPILSRQEGRSRVVTNAGGDAVDAGSVGAKR